MEIAVTGASGFLGRAVARHLRTAGATVHALARRELPGVRRVASYADAPAVDVLVHLAEGNDRRRVAEAGDGYARDVARTLDALLAKGYRRVVYGSSAALYGDALPTPHRTSDAVVVADTYTSVKRSSELAVLSRGGTVARLTNVYGPGMSESTVLAAILRQLPGAGTLEVIDTTPVRDFLWIEDAAAALAAMALGSRAGVYNVGSGEGTSIGELVRITLDLAGGSERSVVCMAPNGRPSYLVVDIDETRNAFGWHPTTTLRDGVATLLKLQQGQA